MKKHLILLLVLILGLSLSAKGPYTFLKDGNMLSKSILDMSSNTGKIEFSGNLKIHVNRLWMINFQNNQWDFPEERSQLSSSKDTVFLHGGDVLHVTIVDFSSRRRVFEYKEGGRTPISQIKRIYFCCMKLPAAFESSSGRNIVKSGDSGKFTTFLVDGRMIEEPIKYLNDSKTGFTDGLQINTKDIWMINLVDKSWNFAAEQREVDKQKDSIFLKNGAKIFDTIVAYDIKKGTFTFEDIDPIHHTKIRRIYFCCHPVPQNFRSGKTIFRKRTIRR